MRNPEPLSALPLPVQENPVIIQGATVFTGKDKMIDDGYVVFDKGLIVAVGSGNPSSLPSGVVRIDGRGKFVSPGIIDTHSHMGVYAWPYVQGLSDGNESTAPTTADVWAEHGFWPQDPALRRAVAAGVTTVQVLPGSANLVGGRSFVAKLHPKTHARAMRFPDAPQGLKMACGENPKRVHGAGGGPKTRMGNVAGYRKLFQRGVEYARSQRAYTKKVEAWKKGEGEQAPEPPAQDLELETIAKVLDGEILVHIHCYRADEMHLMLDLAQTYGFEIRSFHHALEAYKLRDRLAKRDVASSTWADWWGFKMEAYDGIPQNAAMLEAAGARAIIHSDSPSDIRILNQEAAKAMTAGRKVGIETTEVQAMRWLTANPAWALGVQDRTGTLERGKMADVVLWDGNPFSVYTKVEKTYIDGVLVHDAGQPPSLSDFELSEQASKEPQQ